MMKKLKIVNLLSNQCKTCLFVLVVLIFNSCSNNNVVQQTSDSKNLRLVSLTPSITKDLQDLQLSNNIVGATSYCKITENNKELIVGSVMEVNLEKILLLKPDYVFGSGLTDDKIVANLKNNGVKVIKQGKIESFEGICKHFKEMGKLLSRENIADSIITESKNKINTLLKIVPVPQQKPKVFFQIGAKPIFTVIPGTFMNDYITMANAENIAADLTKGTMTRESVIKRNPDVIFIITMGMLAEEEKKIWETYPQMNAVKNNKIFLIDADKACSPTIVTFTETLEEIINKIYLNK